MLAVLVAGATRAGGAPSAAPQHSIVVAGQGSVAARPDRAQLSFGVSSDAKSASAALRANAAEMTKVIAALKAQGIAAADLRTDLVSLSPRYSQNGETVVGYTATNSVSATVRNLAKIGAIIDAAVGAGANQVSGPDLVRSSATALYRVALRAAIADARGKARTIAAASGLHIRRITDVSREQRRALADAADGEGERGRVDPGRDRQHAGRGDRHGHLRRRLGRQRRRLDPPGRDDSNAAISSSCSSVRPMSSSPFSSRCRRNGSNSNATGSLPGAVIVSASRSTVSSVAAIRRRTSCSGSVIVTSPICDAFAAKMSPNDGATIDLEAVVLERPGGVLPRRAAAEVPSGDQDRRPGVLGPVQLERRVLPPVVEQELAVAGALDPLQELLRDDLVGVDVGAVEHRDAAGRSPEGLHAAATSRARPRVAPSAPPRPPSPG